MRKVLLTVVVASMALMLVVGICFAGNKTAAPSPGKVVLIDINSAPVDVLKSLGIGEGIARKIIEGRPYAKKDQLVSRKIMPMPEYKKIANKIVARAIKVAPVPPKR